MSTIGRTLKNLAKVGPGSYIRQMDTIGDTKWGRLVGTDVFGNKYFENNDEISGRERWVEYASIVQPDGADISPEWHGWLARMVQEPITEQNFERKKWMTDASPNFTGTPKAFKTYNTTRPKINAWDPVAKARV
ncbi:NADH ubiquinone oxidoreductase subunit NDUFA12-domain-containing protein [Gongronella butleri]|nr:NADH ubiquinone oxidoreductase subunit NDUFA12-domain-containing protein [Gongronella butleri]